MDVDVDLIGWVGVGLGGTYGCRCGILYLIFLDMAGCVYISFQKCCVHGSKIKV